MFKELHHTADKALYIEAIDLNYLFYDAAIGLTQLADVEFINCSNITNEIYYDSNDDINVLFIEWLNYIIFKLNNNFYLINAIIEINENSVKAKAWFNTFNKLNLLIKSATYHNFNIEKKGELYFCTVVFDI
ncbi:MAG: archease [Ignavibacteria bacterium]|nr:archease [Ignavibacteria bacterium]